MEGEAESITPARKPIDLPASDALSIVKKWQPTLKGRKVGVLVTDGADPTLVNQLVKESEKERATAAIVRRKPRARNSRAACCSRLIRRSAAPHRLSSITSRWSFRQKAPRCC